MLEVGNGHKAPAIALKKAINDKFPGKYNIEVIDLFKELGYEWLLKSYRYFWIDLGLKHPNALTFIYHLSDNRFILWYEKSLLAGVCKRFKKYISKNKPDIVLGTHESCIHVLSILKSKLEIPLVGINTDPFDAHYVWASPNIDKYVVFSEKARELLSKKGVKKSKLVSFNSRYPLDLKHSKKVSSKERIRKKLGLKDKKTILMSIGAEGVGNIKKFLNSIIKNNLNFQVLMICGRNKILKRELDSIKILKNGKVSLKVYGFVENMHELIQASDVILGKPGASQTFEILSKNRPIIYSTFARNEYPTLQFVLDNGFGWHTARVKGFVSLLKSIDKDPEILKKASEKIKNYGLSSCSHDLAGFVDGLLK